MKQDLYATAKKILAEDYLIKTLDDLNEAWITNYASFHEAIEDVCRGKIPQHEARLLRYELNQLVVAGKIISFAMENIAN